MSIDHIGSGPRPVSLAPDDVREIIEDNQKRPPEEQVRCILMVTIVGEEGQPATYATRSWGPMWIEELSWIAHLLQHEAEVRGGLRVCDQCGDFHGGGGQPSDTPQGPPEQTKGGE